MLEVRVFHQLTAAHKLLPFTRFVLKLLAHSDARRVVILELDAGKLLGRRGETHKLLRVRRRARATHGVGISDAR